jgi:hypothetical protein
VHGHVDQRRGGVADGLVALVEVARPVQALDEFFGDRRAGLVMPGMALQHLGLLEPVLEQLRRQLDEIAQHVGA